MMTKLDLTKFSRNERSALIKVASYAKEHQDSTVPAREISDQINQYHNPNSPNKQYLELSSRHINSMYIVLQDVKIDIQEHYENQDVKSGLADTMVNDPGGMKDRSKKGTNGLIENGLKRTA